MESCGFYRTAPIIEALPAVVKSEGVCGVFAKFGCCKVNQFAFGFQDVFRCWGSRQFAGGVRSGNLRRRAIFNVGSAESKKCDFRNAIAPLEPQSSAGNFLSRILKNQRHLFQMAAAQQLEELAADRNGAIARQMNSLDLDESSLHGRIAEMKEHECQLAVEEVMYMLVVHKFSEIEVPMVPRLSECINNGRVEIWASKDRELESIHSLEVQGLIREHLSTILGRRGKSDITDNWTTTQIRRLQLGRIYAASIMYGYFLKSACLRHRLELNLSLSMQEFPLSRGICLPLVECQPCESENFAMLGDVTPRTSSVYQGLGREMKLRQYIMGFDPETLQRCAKLKSKAAVNLIEKHTWALFGDEETVMIENDEMLTVTFSSFKRLVLEAVAFGSFLWDMEGYVDSLYGLKAN